MINVLCKVPQCSLKQNNSHPMKQPRVLVAPNQPLPRHLNLHSTWIEHCCSTLEMSISIPHPEHLWSWFVQIRWQSKTEIFSCQNVSTWKVSAWSLLAVSRLVFNRQQISNVRSCQLSHTLSVSTISKHSMSINYWHWLPNSWANSVLTMSVSCILNCVFQIHVQHSVSGPERHQKGARISSHTQTMALAPTTSSSYIIKGKEQRVHIGQPESVILPFLQQFSGADNVNEVTALHALYCLRSFDWGHHQNQITR